MLASLSSLPQVTRRRTRRFYAVPANTARDHFTPPPVGTSAPFASLFPSRRAVHPVHSSLSTGFASDVPFSTGRTIPYIVAGALHARVHAGGRARANRNAGGPSHRRRVLR